VNCNTTHYRATSTPLQLANSQPRQYYPVYTLLDPDTGLYIIEDEPTGVDITLPTVTHSPGDPSGEQQSRSGEGPSSRSDSYPVLSNQSPGQTQLPDG